MAGYEDDPQPTDDGPASWFVTNPPRTPAQIQFDNANQQAANTWDEKILANGGTFIYGPGGNTAFSTGPNGGNVAAPGTPVPTNYAGSTAWWNPSDPKGSILKLLEGKPLTSATLASLKPQFDAVGIQISPANAEGIVSKINVPGVGWVRVGDGGTKGADGGGQFTGWTWVPQGDGSGGGGSNLANLTGGPGPFTPQTPAFTPTPFTPPPAFVAPTAEEAMNTPGYQFTRDEGIGSLQKLAFSRGTGLTGGTVKAAEKYATNLANTTYGDVFSRALATQQNAFTQGLQTNQNTNATGLAANANNFGQELSTHNTQYGDLYNLAALGLNATNSSYA